MTPGNSTEAGQTWTARISLLCAAGSLSFLLAACASVRRSEPPRTATEELLISQAAEQAMSRVDFQWLEGKKVFIEDKYFESYDKGQAVSLIRAKIALGGGLLTSTNDKADVIVEIRSGALSVNSSDFMIGVPSLTLPVPVSGPVTTPEIAFFKDMKDDGIAKFSLFAYGRETGAYTNASGPDSGRAHYYMYKLFGIGWTRTDVPELKKQKSSD
jgi:hypothetical protein